MNEERISALLGSPVTDVRRVFGGNARQAFAFTAGDVDGILLSQVQRGQVESDPDAEFRVLRRLEGGGVRAPRALAVDRDGSVVGAPSIALERLPGTASISAFLSPDDAEAARRLTADLARATAELHNAPAGSSGERTAPADTYVSAGCPGSEGHTPPVVADWRALFEEARLEPHPIIASLYGWLEDHAPTPARTCIVHGDLRPGNVLYDGDRITGLLDWEMAHDGDPAEDLAWIHRPMWSPEKNLPLDDFLDVYDEHATVPADRAAVDYWRVFCEVKFATISLRAARAFHEGWSTNLRLADRAAMVTGSVRQALEWADAAA